MTGILQNAFGNPTCQQKELKLEIRKKTGRAKRRAKQKSGGGHGPPSPPLRIATAYLSVSECGTG